MTVVCKMLAIAFSITSVVCAQEDDRVQPIANLPAHVVAAEKKLTLFADFANKAADKVPLYIVNRTDEPLALPAQDGDVYVKLQYQLPDGTWKRGQSHAYSWCGNSYMLAPTIAPGTFMKVTGYAPDKGTKAKVRYAFYNGKPEMPAESNIGDGYVVDDEIKKAENDAMNVYRGDFEYVSKVARGEIKLDNTIDHITDLRRTAIRSLGNGKFDKEKSLAVLRNIVAAGGDDAKSAEEAIRSLTAQPEPPAP